MIGISTGPETHLDHLIPLCALLEMPLIVTDPEQLELAKVFYPQVKVECIEPIDLTLDFLARFKAIFHCGKFWSVELKPLIELVHGKKICFVFCPHGNSDKEQKLPPYDLALVYGEQMQKIASGKTVVMGNMRYNYYLDHQAHLDRLAQERVFSSFDPDKKTILYAPTWQTEESPTSFFDAAEQLIDQLGQDYNLLIKLHPLLPETDPAHYWNIVGRFEDRAKFLTQFPAIYPLLEKSDLYIGDYSSIGYDFLLYDRPMFFFKAKTQKTLLQNCGEILSLKTLKKQLTHDQKELSAVRKKIYLHAFTQKRPLAELALLKKVEDFFVDF